jgi:hypothetical protein
MREVREALLWSPSMPFLVICQGCARRLEVADDYPRRKMRCPQCGVMCELPPPGKERAAQSVPAKPPAAKAAHAERQPAPIPAKAAAQVPPRPAKAVYRASQDDDGLPYAVDGGLPIPCPNCQSEMEPNARICVACGYDHETGAVPEKVYEPVERAWEAAMPFKRRLKYALLCVGAFFALGFVGTLASGAWLSFLLSWLTFTGMVLFLFGTYDRVNLSRNRRGLVKLHYAWRFCFLEFRSERLALKDYQGIVSGRAGEIGLLHWVMLGLFILSGVMASANLAIGALMADKVDFLEWAGMLVLMVLSFLPAGITFYIFFLKMEFYTALSAGHGYPTLYLYRGWSEEHMKELAETISRVSTLPYQRG